MMHLVDNLQGKHYLGAFLSLELVHGSVMCMREAQDLLAQIMASCRNKTLWTESCCFSSCVSKVRLSIFQDRPFTPCIKVLTYTLLLCSQSSFDCRSGDDTG